LPVAHDKLIERGKYALKRLDVDGVLVCIGRSVASPLLQFDFLHFNLYIYEAA